MKIEYDDERFFHQYAQMSRSREGLSGAGKGPSLRSCSRMCGKNGS